MTEYSMSAEKKEFWEKIRKIEGLSVQIGLERVSGQMDVYEKALKLLTREIDKCTKSLNEFLAAGDMNNFTIEVHSMKSSLANLGAIELSGEAYKLEIASGRNDANICAPGVQPFLDALNAMKNKLLEAFSVLCQSYTVITVPSVLAEILIRLKEAIESTDFVEINRELKNMEDLNPDADLKNEVEEINDMVMIMDYDGAMEVIGKLLNDK